MTVLVLVLTTAVALAFGTGLHVVASAAVDKARAQAAADAAALAAVAEAAPYGRGVHDVAADRFARANGATVVDVEHVDPTSVIVTVAFGGTEARARGVLDPALLGPASVAEGTAGLHPVLEEAVNRILRASGGRVRLVSGYRSPEHQERLWSRAMAGYGDPEVADDWVARPGASLHERGLAVDLGGDLMLAVALIDRFALPLHRPLANEPWHFELDHSRNYAPRGSPYSGR